MATRQILINISAEGGQFAAEIQKMTDKTAAFNKAAVQGTQQITASLSGLPTLLGVIGNSFGAAFGVAGIIAFGRSVLNAAGEIDDLAKKTGFARQTLSGIKSTIEESGGSLSGFATAINKAQKSLGDIEGDGKKAAQALRAMGLDVKALAAASPERFFETFAAALAKVEDQNTRVAIATRVMGRAGADQIPIILELADKFDKLKKAGASDEDIARLDAFGDAWTRFGSKLRIGATGFIADVLRDLENISEAIAESNRRMGLFQPRKGGAASAMPGWDWSKSDSGLGNMNPGDLLRPGWKKAGLALDLGDPDADAAKAKAAAEKAAAALKHQSAAIEQASTKLAQLKLADAEAARAAGDLNVEVLALSLALIGQEHAAQLSAIAHDKQLTPAVKEQLKVMADLQLQYKATAAVTAESAKRQIEENKQIEASFAARLAMEERIEEIRREELEYLRKSAELKERANDFQVQRMQAAGVPENAILAEQIRLLQAKRAALDQQPNRQAGDAELLDQQIELARIRLLKLQDTAIDVAGEVGRVVTDITTAIIQGTLKWADVGRSILASFVRVALERFTGFLRSMQQSAQATQLLGGGAMPMASGATQGGGGFMQSVGNMFGGGGSGGGGMMQGLMGMFSGGSGFGFGSAPAGVAGPAMANGGFFSGGMAGGAINGLTGLMDSGGGMMAGLFGGMMTGGSGGKLGVGGQILGSLASSAMMSGISLGLGGTGGLMGGLITTMAGSMSVPVIGWIVAAIAAIILAITSIFGAQKPNPTVMVKSKIEGFLYDEFENQFKAGSVVSKARGIDIPQSAVNSTKTAVQQLLEGLSKQWTAILNLFPVIVHDEMIPKLEAANKLLNRFFGDLKFSEGGSRTIQEEITRLGVRTGPEGFFHALRGTIGAGLTATIKRAGLGDLSELVNKSFGETAPDATFASIRSGSGLKAPQGVADVKPFFEAVGKFVALTSGLGGISKSGIGSFLTEQDMARTTSQFSEVLKITDGKQFTAAVDQLEAELKPVLEFLQKSVQETTSLFSRGMIAALEAVTESGAIRAFNQNLGEGVKQMIFQGITEAFIASAQFNDLLAPIQQTIREFTQQAINTGEAPDIEAFRRAILPDIEDISARAEMLAPLIAEFQKLGIDVKDALKALTGKGANMNFTIDFSGGVSVRSEADIEAISRQLASLISGALPPA